MLLEGSFAEIGPGQKIRVGTMLSAIANCTNTVLGSGTLAVPAAMSNAGLVSYEVVVVGVFIATFISMRWLIAVADALPPDQPRNYEGIAKQYLGNAAAGAISGAFMFGGFALTIAYMLLISTSVGPLVAGLREDDPSEDTVKQTNKVVCWVIGLLVVLPLSLLRDISSLKFTSTLAILTLAYASVYVVYAGTSGDDAGGVEHAPAEPWTFFRWETTIFECCSMTVSAFSCHISAMPIYEALGPQRTPRHMMMIVFSSISIAAVIYQFVGIAGYTRFGRNVKGNILASVYDANGDSLGLQLAQAGIAMTLIFSMPLVMWPLRSCTISLFRGAQMEPSARTWYATTCSLMTVTLVTASLDVDVKSVMAVGGSVGGAFIVFIYPSAFFLAVVKKHAVYDFLQRDNIPQLAMIAVGIIAGVICLTVSVQHAIKNLTGE